MRNVTEGLYQVADGIGASRRRSRGKRNRQRLAAHARRLRRWRPAPAGFTLGGPSLWSISNVPFGFFCDAWAMNQPDQRRSDKEVPKPSRSEELLRIIEEYVDDLREIIRKLRRKMN
jgi:hypothetical protein